MKTPLRFRRGDTSPLRPGLVFWGMAHGKEWFVTPEKFEEFRQKKNALARNAVPSEESKTRKRLWDREYARTPKRKAQIAEFQRQNRHRYSPNYKAKRRAYKKMRRATDPMFRLKANIGARIRIALKRQGTSKTSKSISLLGCSVRFFREWIEWQFEPGMTFDNYGFNTWHLDHVVPLALFDLSNREVQRYAFNWRNVRPAWGKPNLSKNAKLDMALVEKYFLQDWLKHTKIIQIETVQAA